MTTLEDRLRRELSAEAGQITPGSIGGLQLPPAGAPRRGGRQHRRAWARPLAAAAAVAAVVGGTFAVVRAIPGAPPAARPRPGASTVLPACYAYTVEGYVWHQVTAKSDNGQISDRYLAIRATATGKLLATISPPKPYNDIGLLTAGADGRVFVLGLQHLWDRGPNSSLTVTERDEATPMKFLVVRVTPAGRVQMSGLFLRGAPARAQLPSIALSPDGTRLAVAYGGAGRPGVLEVVTLATGRVRRWVSRASWTPQVQAAGGWAANGRTLAVEEVANGGSPASPATYRPPRSTRVRLLDTGAPGARLAAAPLLVLHAPAGLSAPDQLFLTPDGSQLISPVLSPSPDGTYGTYLTRGTLTGGLATYSAQSGALLRTAAPWVWRFPSPPGRGGQPKQVLAWSDARGGRLIVLQPRHDLNSLDVLTGNGFTAAGRDLLPRRSARTALQDALRHPTLMAW